MSSVRVTEGAMAAITGLKVIYGRSTPAPAGYHKIPVDLNKNARGEYIYICYSTTEAGAPITNVQVFAGDSSDFPIQEGYVKINNDLNKGARGKFIYLCYTRDTSLSPITALNVIQGETPQTYPPGPSWIRIDQDCSQGAGGDYTYVTYQRAKK